MHMHTYLKEGKPLFQFIHWKHLDTNKAHSFNDTDDGGGVILGVTNFMEEPTTHRMESGLRQHTNDLSIEVCNLLHTLYIGVSTGPRGRNRILNTISPANIRTEWEERGGRERGGKGRRGRERGGEEGEEAESGGRRKGERRGGGRGGRERGGRRKGERRGGGRGGEEERRRGSLGHSCSGVFH